MASQKLTTQLYSQTGDKIKEINLNPAIFGVEPKTSVVHQVAIAQKNNSRSAIAHTKDRSEVRGGGVKPWRQKGTGRARHGSVRSPLWVGGGVTFGPSKERNFSQKVNKKMKTQALFMCLSDKVNNNLLILLDKLELPKAKTKELVTIIKNLKNTLKLKPKLKKSDKSKNSSSKKPNKNFDIKKYKMSLLIVLPASNRKIFTAGRNLEGIKIITVNSLNVIDLLKYQKILMLESNLQAIEKHFLKIKEMKK